MFDRIPEMKLYIIFMITIWILILGMSFYLGIEHMLKTREQKCYDSAIRFYRQEVRDNPDKITDLEQARDKELEICERLP